MLGFHGPHDETPLHWAASSDDVEALDALLDAGADIEASGAVLGGGPPMADAEAFWSACHGAQQQAAEYLLERGADPNWIGWDDLTPLDVAEQSQDSQLVSWLRSKGAKTADDLQA